MKGILIAAGAALLIAVPAAIGLVGNTSFSQSVPVRVPSQATLLDDAGNEHATSTTEPGDDKGGEHATSTTEPGDDKGGQRATGSGGGTESDSGSGKGQNGGHGRSNNRTASTDDGAGHR